MQNSYLIQRASIVLKIIYKFMRMKIIALLEHNNEVIYCNQILLIAHFRNIDLLYCNNNFTPSSFII